MQKRSFSKRSFGSRPNPSKKTFSRKKGGFAAAKIDVSKFVQKSSSIKEEVYIPENKFTDFNVDARLKNNIVKKGYVNPTAIQDKIIPLIIEGKDVVGIANTGTGKTAAFLVPTINKSLLNKQNKVIIIVPTRELALQVEKEFRILATGLNLFSVLCIGGTDVRVQIRNLRRNNDFVVGTPGRIKDMVQRKEINMAQFKTVVLDEADRMLDMGFVEDMRFLMEQMPQSKQVLLFSATLPIEIDKLSNQFLKDSVKVSVKTRESSANVDQDIIRVNGDNNKKLEILCELLNKSEFNKVLIFGKTKFGVDRLSKTLIQKGFKADAIHGDKKQGKRKRIIENFKVNQTKILVATDVAARGLDINNITHVINYDIPATYEDYVHRIGRTGRGNKKGEALTFV
jgi:superfamily II DNA/RNA helicase